MVIYFSVSLPPEIYEDSFKFYLVILLWLSETLTTMMRLDSPGTRSSSSSLVRSSPLPLQVTELRKAFDSFDSDKRGAISSETTGTILRMMGVRVSGEELAAIMDDIDVDKSGQLEFEEFVILSARFTLC